MINKNWLKSILIKVSGKLNISQLFDFTNSRKIKLFSYCSKVCFLVGLHALFVFQFLLVSNCGRYTSVCRLFSFSYERRNKWQKVGNKTVLTCKWIHMMCCIVLVMHSKLVMQWKACYFFVNRGPTIPNHTLIQKF